MQNLTKLILLYLIMTTSASAALALDRTRVIFEQDSKLETIKIKNPADKPFLAQSWLSDINGEEANNEFVVIPPVMRIESNDYAILRIKALPLIENLPKDRESVYYLHVREVPPAKSSTNSDNKKNVGSIQIAIESVIKFFYRPSALSSIKNVDRNIMNSTKIIRNSNNTIDIENGSPFYVTLSELKIGASKEAANFKPTMMAPFSRQSFKVGKSRIYTLSHINDYGATVTNTFECKKSNVCLAQEKE